MSDKTQQVLNLRSDGKTYREIDQLLSLPKGKSWLIANRKRHQENSRESTNRYRARGGVPLCEMPSTGREQD